MSTLANGGTGNIMSDMEPDMVAGRPIIEYPCRWEYKAIGMDEALMARPSSKSWPIWNMI